MSRSDRKPQRDADPRQTRGSASPFGCSQTRPCLHLLAEGELDGLRERWVAGHLRACAKCRAELAELRLQARRLLEVAVEAPSLPASFAAKVGRELRGRRAHRRHQHRNTALAALVAALAAAAVVTLALRSPTPPAHPPRGISAVALDGAASSREPAAPRGAPAVNGAPGLSRAGSSRAGSSPAGSSAAGSSAVARRPVAVSSRHEPFDRFDEEEACLAEDPLVPRPAVAAFGSGKPPGRSSSPATRGNCGVGDVVVFTSWVGGHSAGKTDATWPSIEEAPCPPDPNSDGKMDGSDVAFYWQRLLGPAQVPISLAATDSMSDEEEGDDPCRGV